MNVITYPIAIDGWSVSKLEREIDMFNPLLGNHWIGKHDQPENTIEKYIQDCYSMYFEERFPTAKGFEWWFHSYSADDNGLGFHSDHDEIERQEDGTMKYPLRSTVTYIRDQNVSPTIILNTETGLYPNAMHPLPPTEAVISNPDDGKLLEFNPRYLHAVFPPNKGRKTLMFNIWDYRPRSLPRVGKTALIYDLRFYKEEPVSPVAYLGKKLFIECDITPDKRIKLTGPDDKTDGATWLVHQ